VIIGIAMAGYFVRPIGWILRIVLALSGIGLLIPPGGAIAHSWLANAIGAAVSALFIVLEWRGRKAVAAA